VACFRLLLPNFTQQSELLLYLGKQLVPSYQSVVMVKFAVKPNRLAFDAREMDCTCCWGHAGAGLFDASLDRQWFANFKKVVLTNLLTSQVCCDSVWRGSSKSSLFSSTSAALVSFAAMLLRSSLAASWRYVSWAETCSRRKLNKVRNLQKRQKARVNIW